MQDFKTASVERNCYRFIFLGIPSDVDLRVYGEKGKRENKNNLRDPKTQKEALGGGSSA